MKKKLYGLMFAILLLCVTGCGSKSPEEIIQKSADNMNKLENYNMYIGAEMAISAEGQTMDLEIHLDSKVDTKNKTIEMKMFADFAGFTMETDGYIETKDREIITYNKEMDSDKWTKTTQRVEEPENGIDATKTVSSISETLKNAKNIEEKETNEENTKTYMITISKEESEELFNTLGTASEDLQGTELELTGDVKIEVIIDTEKYYIKSITMNLADAMQQEEGMTYEKMLMKFKFSKFNEIGEVRIPTSIMDSAIEESENDNFDNIEEENNAYGVLDAARLYYAEQTLSETPVLEGITIKDLNIVGQLPQNPEEVVVTYNADGTINISVMKFNNACYEVIKSTVEETTCP